MTDQMQPGETPSGDQQPKSINTEGGAYVEGSVNTGGGHFIGRDWIQKIFLGEREDVIHLRNRQTMLQLVKSIWVEGLLEKSLYKEVLIELSIEYKPETWQNPWNAVVQEIGANSKTLEPGTKIVNVFNQFNQALLILGQPGAGKTNLLLQLARDLIEQSEFNQLAPIPVVFNLSSWADKRKPINEWLIDELGTKYRIPEKVAQPWVENDELLLLLDGLDEVGQQHRDDCVKAINDYRDKHLVPFTICSRVDEYKLLTTRLNIRDAILVEPLKPEKIYSYLELIGLKSQLINAFESDSNLLELANSPLMLNIIALAYDKDFVDELIVQNTSEGHRTNIFNFYIKRMFRRRQLKQSYTPKDTLQWLSWLAGNMLQRAPFSFQIESLQPSWLQTPSFIRWYKIITFSIVSLILGMSGGVFIGVNSKLILGLTLGIISGLILTSDMFLGRKILADQNQFDRQKIVAATLFALVGGLGLDSSNGLVFGLVFGLSFLPLFYLCSGLNCIEVVEKIKFNVKTTMNFTAYMPKILLGSFLFVWMANVFIQIYKFGEQLTFTLLLRGGFLSGIESLMILGFAWLILVPFVLLSSEEISQTVVPNQGIRESARNMLNIGLGMGLIVGLIFWLCSVLLGIEMQFVLKFILVTILVASLAFGIVFGGLACIQHIVLRILLWIDNLAPLNYAKFLDYCHERIFLRKVGGGYIFIHRMLMEHFASLTDEDIQRIARQVEAGR